MLITVGVFAANDWFPKTDAFNGKKTGWFGKELPKNATSAWNPFPPPSPTPQLSKEYIYAGQRLLAVEDANATSAPPADIAVWRPSNGDWMIMGQTGSQATQYAWGGSGDVPVPGDYDGDGKTDFAIWRPGTGAWWIFYSSTATHQAIAWGQTGDIPVPADYDGDGKTDVAVARANATSGYMQWYPAYSATATTGNFDWGAHTDLPAPADYDGDGVADAAVYRSSNQIFYWVNSSNAATATVNIGATVTCAVPNQCIVSSDYDGDGKADPAVYNSSNANWHILPSTTSQTSPTVQTYSWGSAGNIPVHNDYDGDGKTDLAVWNNAASAQWSIKRSTNGTTRTETFGTTGDIPVPAFYRR